MWLQQSNAASQPPCANRRSRRGTPGYSSADEVPRAISVGVPARVGALNPADRRVSSGFGSTHGVSANRETRGTRRRDIQGLRAVAVTLVVLDHFTGWPTGGFIGVDIFFVISGFLISSLMLREYDRTGSISLRSFYVRRMRRLFPAAFACLAAVAVASLYLFNRSRAIDSVVDTGWALAFMANWRFAIKGTDYLQAELAPSPVQHYWSLAVEEQFYFVWPLLLIMMLTLGNRWSRRAGTSPGRGPVLAGTLVISVLSFGWALYETGTNPTVAYFSSLTRAWELGVGVVVALAAARFSPTRAVRTVLAWVGLIGIGGSAVLISPLSAFPGPTAIWPVLATAALLLSGLGGTPPPMVVLNNPVSDFVGKISYSLYLWHWPVVVFLEPRLPWEGLGAFTVLAVVSLALSTLSFFFVEEPFRRASGLGYELHLPWTARARRSAKRRKLRRRLLAPALVVIAVLLVAPAVANVLRAPETLSTEGVAGARALTEGSTANAPSDVSFAPAVDQLADDVPILYAKACHQYRDGTRAAACTFDYSKGQDNPVTVALVGDSHAVQWFPALDIVAEQQGWLLQTYTKAACPLNAAVLAYPAPTRYDACVTWNEGVMQELTRTGFDRVIVAASASYSALLADGELVRGSRADQLMAQGYTESWEELVSAGVPVVMVEDSPRPGVDVVECLALHTEEPAQCAFPRHSALRKSSPMKVAAEGMTGVQVVDLNDYICPDQECQMVVGGLVVYRDGNHLTASYSTSLAPMLKRALGDSASPE